MERIQNTGRGIAGFLGGLFRGGRDGIASGATIGLAVGGVMAVLGTGGAVLPLLITAAGIGAVAGGAGGGLLGSLIGVFKGGQASADCAEDHAHAAPAPARAVEEASPAPAPAFPPRQPQVATPAPEAPATPATDHGQPHDLSHETCTRYQDQVAQSRTDSPHPSHNR